MSIRPEFEGDWSRSVNARASSAGRSGAGAFSKAFGVGLKGIGAIAGVAIAANLSSAAAGAAALAPALATAGAAAGALKLGLSGVGDAFKAAFADSSADATAAASATRAVESAQRGLTKAQQGLADARVQAAERIKEAQKAVGEAEQNLARVVEDSAQRQKDAQQSVVDAERNLKDAQVDARQAQMSLNDARNDAVRSLQDMNDQLAGARLDEREAVMRQAEAEKALRAAQSNPGVTPEQLAKLQLAYDRATLNLSEQRRETKELATDTAKANKAGVEGSKQVTDAKDRIAQANQTVVDRERDLTKARTDQRRTAVDAARDIADAQQGVADAQAGVAKARQEGARQIRDAEQSVADAAQAVSDAQAAAAAQTSKYAEAMSKLAPNAQSFVRAVQRLSPAWDAMRLAVQNRLFQGLDSTVTSLGRTTIPILHRQLTGTAGVWNEIAKNAAGGISEMAKSGMLDKILSGATKNLAVFKNTPKQVIGAFGQLAVAAQPAFNKLLTQAAGAITHFTDGLSKSFASGGLQQAIDTAFGILSQFGTLLGNVLGTVSQIFKAASDAGGQIVGVLGSVFGELRKILASDEMQAQMRSLFSSVAQIVAAIVPVIGGIVQAVVPLLAAIAQPVAVLAKVLGPVLQQLVGTLGAVLMPIVQALGPVLVTVGVAIVQIVQSLMPLLQPIAQLITSVIMALAPALTPIINVITGLVGVLVGPLTTVIRTLTPVLVQIGTVVGRVFTALEPVLAPLVSLIGKIAGLVAQVFAVALQKLMNALQPLIPVGMQLITTVLNALLPILPTVGSAFGTIAGAALAIIGPLTAVYGSIATQLAPILVKLAPILGSVIGLFVTTVAQVLPPLTTALLTLVQAFLPLMPVVGNLLGLIVQMAGNVLLQLLPSLLQLVQATVALTVALLPLLPPLTQIIALVIRLSINIVSTLLPPLASLAGFLIGGLATALSTVIGWIAGLVNSIAGLVGWVVNHLGPAFIWLNAQVIQPVWRLIQTAIKSAWEGGIRPVFGYINSGVNGVAGVMRGFRDKVVRPVWGTVVSIVKGAYYDGIRPAFNVLKDGLNRVSGAFDDARKAIKLAWDKVKAIAKSPVSFLIDTVYNAGIVGVWNKIASAFGAPTLKEFHPKGFASGGILPGYTPGRDVHRFVSPTGGALDLSGGESIFRPEFTRGVGTGFVSYFNQVAKSSGAAGVRKALAPVLGGNPRTPVDRSLRYANGGVYPHQVFADGGIFGWISKAAGAVAGVGSAAWNKVKGGASWLASTLQASAKAGAKAVIDPIMKNFPGMDTSIGKMIRRIPDRILDALFSFSKKADDKGAGQIGGPRIQAALKWARTQNGLPYQWGGNGNPSWDCSGFMSAIESVIRGQKPHRRWATGSFSGKTAPPGWVYHGNSPFRIGITNAGVGHTAGTLGKTNVESRGGDGVIVGKRARGYHDKLFGSWYGFQPGKFDNGGWMQPGWNYNGLGVPEPVLTPNQLRALEGAAAAPGGLGDLHVSVFVGDREITDIARAEIRDSQQQLISVLNAG
ncbi:hypothetical protein [Streptomyces sp. NPDC047990]|uniref:hypothetical protein n=1 Tax=Streptomyces sp. NPDC047990 TaxID=3365496 RepID=UPI003712F98D